MTTPAILAAQMVITLDEYAAKKGWTALFYDVSIDVDSIGIAFQFDVGGGAFKPHGVRTRTGQPNVIAAELNRLMLERSLPRRRMQESA